MGGFGGEDGHGGLKPWGGMLLFHTMLLGHSKPDLQGYKIVCHIESSHVVVFGSAAITS